MILQDLKYAVRQLRSGWGFATLAVVTLALGIGANTAMFTVVESVLLRPLPYPHSNRLVIVAPAGTAGSGNASYLNYRDIRDQSQKLEAVASYSEDVSVVEGKNGSISVTAPRVTPNALTMVGAQPLLGRTFTETEGHAGGPQVTILSEGLWRQSYDSDPNILGRTVKIGGIERTVVGVMPASFRFPETVGPDMAKGVWLPLQPSAEMLKDRGYNFIGIVGRMRPGVSVAQAQQDLNAIVQRIVRAEPDHAEGLALDMTSYQEMLTGNVRPVFLALMAALGLVLLIACANVANLLIARCLGRRQEFAVRAALGASRGRLVGQLIAEGAVLSLLGCALGAMLAQFALAGIHKLPNGTVPQADSITMHWSVLVTLAVIATLTTVLSSLLPALLVARTDPQPALQASSRGIGSRSVSGKLSGGLVAGEVALSTLLLVGTGLLFHTLWNLAHTRLGFDVDRITTFTAMPADSAGFSAMAVSADAEHAPLSIASTIYSPSLARLRQTPGVRYAALATAPPLSGVDMHSSFDIVGHPTTHAHHPEARITAASEDYAAALGTPLVHGRMISADDTAAASPVVVVNEALVKKYFPNTDPLQHQIDLGGKDTGMLKPWTIVGVLGDQIDHKVGGEVQPLILIPYQQVPTISLFYQALLKTFVTFIVKTRGDMPVAATARDLFKQTAPDYALDNFQTMQETIDSATFSQRLGLYLTASFAGLAIVMVVAGLYGVLAQLVSYRRREIGVRMALGATREGIAKMILRQGGILIGIGLGAGLVIAVFAGQLVKSFLYQVKPIDLGTYVGVTILLLVIGSIASLIPAHSASTIEPMEALRED
ncbi:putative permease [Silvibacterium bohemicum]|uniref:Putative permease n=1 Tax=Silvibacterium bohemicum TaxID=1577686 RepID=A0A841JXN1_9BACT|nr:ABC transporter permease [Silvibacterium bohemicum]MBB6145910.1 putative permease [Silvibacterium bohemicum]